MSPWQGPDAGTGKAGVRGHGSLDGSSESGGGCCCCCSHWLALDRTYYSKGFKC